MVAWDYVPRIGTASGRSSPASSRQGDGPDAVRVRAVVVRGEGGQLFLSLVLMEPLTPLGKNPPDLTEAGLR